MTSQSSGCEDDDEKDEESSQENLQNKFLQAYFDHLYLISKDPQTKKVKPLHKRKSSCESVSYQRDQFNSSEDYSLKNKISNISCVLSKAKSETGQEKAKTVDSAVSNQSGLPTVCAEDCVTQPHSSVVVNSSNFVGNLQKTWTASKKNKASYSQKVSNILDLSKGGDLCEIAIKSDAVFKDLEKFPTTSQIIEFFVSSIFDNLYNSLAENVNKNITDNFDMICKQSETNCNKPLQLKFFKRKPGRVCGNLSKSCKRKSFQTADSCVKKQKLCEVSESFNTNSLQTADSCTEKQIMSSKPYNRNSLHHAKSCLEILTNTSTAKNVLPVFKDVSNKCPFQNMILPIKKHSDKDFSVECEDILCDKVVCVSDKAVTESTTQELTDESYTQSNCVKQQSAKTSHCVDCHLQDGKPSLKQHKQMCEVKLLDVCKHKIKPASATEMLTATNSENEQNFTQNSEFSKHREVKTNRQGKRKLDWSDRRISKQCQHLYMTKSYHGNRETSKHGRYLKGTRNNHGNRETSKHGQHLQAARSNHSNREVSKYGRHLQGTRSNRGKREKCENKSFITQTKTNDRGRRKHNSFEQRVTESKKIKTHSSKETSVDEKNKMSGKTKHDSKLPKNTSQKTKTVVCKKKKSLSTRDKKSHQTEKERFILRRHEVEKSNSVSSDPFVHLCELERGAAHVDVRHMEQLFPSIRQKKTNICTVFSMKPKPVLCHPGGVWHSIVNDK